MNIIYAEYNMYRNSIGIYTCAKYMLRMEKIVNCFLGKLFLYLTQKTKDLL